MVPTISDVFLRGACELQVSSSATPVDRIIHGEKASRCEIAGIRDMIGVGSKDREGFLFLIQGTQKLRIENSRAVKLM